MNMKSRREAISGCINVYIMSLILYYLYGILMSGRNTEFFNEFKVIYMAGGAALVYAASFLIRNKGIRIAAAMGACIAYIGADQLLFADEGGTEALLISVILCVLAIGFSRYRQKRSHNIVIFEGAAVMLIIAVAVIEGRLGREISVIPIVTGVVLGLIEQARLNFAERDIDDRKFMISANLVIYASCAAFAVLIVLLHDHIINAFTHIGTLVVNAMQLLVNAFKKAVTMAFELFGMDDQNAVNWVSAEQADGRADFNFWVILGVGIIFTAALILGAVALIIKIKRQERSEEDRIIIYVKRKRSKEIRARIKQEKAERNKRSNIKTFDLGRFFTKAKDPRIFMYKMSRILRKTDYRIRKSESPRQVFNKLISAECITDGLKAELEQMADTVDRYYYAENKDTLYRIEEGRLLLKKIKRETGKRSVKRRQRKGSGSHMADI